MIVVAVIISRRILRKGGVHRPTAVTWLSLLIVLVINTIAGRIADPFLTGGGDAEVPTVSRVIAGLALVIVAVGAGIGAWLLMAHALRAPAGHRGRPGRRRGAGRAGQPAGAAREDA